MIYFVLIFIVLLAICCYSGYIIAPDKCVIAGSKTYMQGCPHRYSLPVMINCVKKSNTILVRAAEDGPIVQNPIENDAGIRYWRKGNTLIIDTSEDFIKGQFYLMEREGEYRIVQCLANDSILPPILNDSSTLITHRMIGRVKAVWDGQRMDYTIQHSKMIVPEADW